MVGTSIRRRVNYFWFAFVIITNERSSLATAASNDRNPYRRYRYNADDDIYSPYNPLWREEQVYTGERRGPVHTSETDSSLTRQRRTGKRSSRAYSPLEKRIHYVDDVSSSTTDLKSSRQWQQHRQQQSSIRSDLHHSGTVQTSYSEFPLQSADIGKIGSGSNSIQHGYDQKPRFGMERGRRKWLFPIDFRRQKSELNIGYSIDDEPTTRKRKRHHAIEGLSNHTALIVTPGNTISPQTGKNRRENTLQVSCSLDPFSLVTLLHQVATGTMGLTSVVVGTFKLLGPMILAKQCLATLGSAFSDRFNRRSLRKESTKQIQYLGKNRLDGLDAVAAARIVTRIVLQILCMSSAGHLIELVLAKAPCLMRPFWICQWWYGLVWLASMYSIALVFQEWIFGHLAQTGNKIHSFVSIHPTTDIKHFASPNYNTKVKSKQRIVKWPSIRLLKRMTQNPEEWIQNLVRIVTRSKGQNDHHRSRTYMAGVNSLERTDLDPLMFPSTWRPLSIVTFLAMSRAIYKSFCTAASSDIVDKLGDAVCEKTSRYRIIRSFIIQKTLYGEWRRVFVEEGRIAWGAGISLIGLLTQMWLIYSVSAVDHVAAIALFSIVMAQIVSTWVSIVLFLNRLYRSTTQ